MRKFIRLLGVLLGLSAAVFGQSTGEKKCSIDGSVVNSVTGAPILRAHISVTGADDSGLTESDAAGKWSVEHLACGRVTVVANRVGFLRAQQNSGLSPNLLLVANTPLQDVKLHARTASGARGARSRRSRRSDHGRTGQPDDLARHERYSRHSGR